MISVASGTNTIRTLFRRLYEFYGRQGWWPAETPFEVMVGAILTQNTAWRNVEMAIKNIKQCMTPEGILKCPDLEERIRPAGFYRQKAERLRALSRFLLEHPMEELAKLPTGKLREMFLAIKGIGKETADSILLYAFGRPVFVVDKYTYRLFVRFGIWKERFDYERIRRLVEKEIRTVEELKEFHALIVEHAKRFCRKRPLCKECPLREFCPTASSNVS